jgi:hypothetical protein
VSAGAAGTIETAVEVLAMLMRGESLERRALARTLGVTVATADRYIRAVLRLPGVVPRKGGRSGRVLFVSFSFGESLRAVGR